MLGSCLQIEDKVYKKTFLRWVRTLGEIIQWMISAIQEVPRLSFEPRVSKLPSAWNVIVSGTFLTAESFGIFLNRFKNWNSFLFFLQNRLIYFTLK